jgi:SPP1 gp7 family putative phage head morphogenesis protein
VAKYGWSYKGKRGWRTNVIYQNNKNTANAAGRWTQQQRVKGTRPYLLYSTAGDTRVRPDHQRWNYYLLPVDHPFWLTHYPPNGWNCRCKVISLSDRDIKRMNLKITEPGSVDLRKISQTDTVTGEVIEKSPGVDLGWDYNPGMAWVAPDIALGRELRKVATSSEKSQHLGGEYQVAGTSAKLSRLVSEYGSTNTRVCSQEQICSWPYSDGSNLCFI